MRVRRRAVLVIAALVVLVVVAAAATVGAERRCGELRAEARVERVYGRTGDGRPVEMTRVPESSWAARACARLLPASG